MTTGRDTIKIGIVDTGIERNNGHFENKNITVVNLPIFGGFFGDQDGHGTLVASLAAARGDDGALAAGVAWQNPLLIADIDAFPFSLNILSGTQRLLDAGAKVINISYGMNGLEERRIWRQSVTEAVRDASRHNALLVFSAGNDSEKNDNQYLPDGSKSADTALWEQYAVIVAATEPFSPSDPFGAGTVQVPTSFSREGAVVDVAAPGRDVGGASTTPHIIRAESGTSFAAPIVTGIAALMWSSIPNADAQTIKYFIVLTATHIAGNVGGGLVNAEGALRWGEMSGRVAAALSPLDPNMSLIKDVGTTDHIFSSVRLVVGSMENVILKTIRWRQSGSSAVPINKPQPLENVKVIVNGAEYIPVISSDGVYYTASFGAGILLNKGGSPSLYVSIQGDIVGGVGETVQFDIERPDHIHLVGETSGAVIEPEAASTASPSDRSEFTTGTPWYDGSLLLIGP